MMRNMLISILVSLCIVAGFVAAQEGQTTGLKGLKVPLEYYPDGSLKALLKSGISTVDSGGQKIRGENVRYETYAEGGATDVVITAENCLYDKAKGHAESDSWVKLKKDDVTITGKGFTLNTEKEMISLHSNVVVEFDKGLMAGGEKKK